MTGSVIVGGSSMNAAEIPSMSASDISLFERLRAQLDCTLHMLPDKPEETPDSTLRCLWHLASGSTLSSDAAMESPLLPLTADQALSLRSEEHTSELQS